MQQAAAMQVCDELSMQEDEAETPEERCRVIQEEAAMLLEDSDSDLDSTESIDDAADTALAIVELSASAERKTREMKAEQDLRPSNEHHIPNGADSAQSQPEPAASEESQREVPREEVQGEEQVEGNREASIRYGGLVLELVAKHSLSTSIAQCAKAEQVSGTAAKSVYLQ